MRSSLGVPCMRELRIQYDNGETAALRLDREHLTLGRSETASLSCPTDFALSRTHCAFDREGEDWNVEDLSSQNGTLVNGAKILRKARLRPGDVLTAGHLILSYVDPDAPGDGDPPLGMDQFGDKVEDDPERTFIAEEPGVEGEPARPPLPPQREPQPTGFAWLDIVSHGPHYGNRYSVAKDFLIGRDRECQLILNDRSVSRNHARLLLENKRYYLYSTGPSGTLLNQIRIHGRQELRDGDEIGIAATILRFRLPINPDEMTTPGKRRLREFDQVWKDLAAAARLDAKEEFASAAERLISGVLAESLGLTLEAPIPFHAGITGYMVKAPALRIRKSHFPILVVSYNEQGSDLRQAVAVQLEQAKATEYFVLFIVVPARDTILDEAKELRTRVVDRVLRNDLIVLDQQHLAELIGIGTPERLLTMVLQQGVELSVLSPYIVAGAVSDQMFFGREKEVKRIKTVQLDDHAVSYALVGGRRIGKSSILHKLTTLMKDDPERYWARQISCDHITDYRDFFATMSEELQVECPSADPRAFRTLVLEKKRHMEKAELVFLFDEVDALLRYDSEQRVSAGLSSVFRSLAHDQVCRFVFSGSRMLFRYVRDPASPFFNFCQELILEPLDPDSVADIVSKPLSQLGIVLEDEGALVRRIVDLTSCHPNLAQWTCDRLLRVIGIHRITMADVEAVADSREFCEHYVRTAWGEARPLEKLITLVMGEPEFDLDELLRTLARYEIKDRVQIQQALEMLQLYILLQRQDTQYRFRLTHFPRLVRKFDDLGTQIEVQLAEIKR
jgi:pSer/pThr/pTyr-binding forkhead associated (FHA) protein